MPVSGGKDGSYVAYQLKHVYGMHPLAITVTPALTLELGNQNLKNFIASGYDHIQINPAGDVLQALNKFGFIHKGFPYFGWLAAIESAVPKFAARFGISLVFYSEEGETEYGGTSKLADTPFYTPSFQKEVYLENVFELVAKAANVSKLQSNSNNSEYVPHFMKTKYKRLELRTLKVKQNRSNCVNDATESEQQQTCKSGHVIRPWQNY